MKKILITLFLALIAMNIEAQVDRTKMPLPGPSPKINLKEAKQFELANGLKVLVVENKKLPRVLMGLRIDNSPMLEGSKAGVANLTASLLGKGSKNISKDAFNEEVDFLGAFINIDSQTADASCLSKYFPRILELLSDATINPNFTQEEFEKEKAKLLTTLKSEDKNVASIAARVQRALSYGKKHPFGEFITEKTVNNITLEDVQNFYSNYFVSKNAYLVIIGDVDFDTTKKLVEKNFAEWIKKTPPSFSFSNPSNVQYTQINFIDVPNAVQSEISVQNLVNLKMSDPDYLAAIMANQILGGAAESRLFVNIREDKGYTYGAYSNIGYDKYGPSRFKAYASVRNMVTDSSVVEFLKEIDLITNKPVSEEELKNTKAKYVGNFVLAIEKPETVANYALRKEIQGLSADFYKTYLERINAITVEDVQKAAKKYFSVANARIVVTGKGSDVLKNLEKISYNGKKIPIFFFDKYANKIEKPNYNVSIPDGVSVKSILNNYFKAIGGKDKAQKIESTYVTASATMGAATLQMITKTTVKSQSLTDILFGGKSVNKNVFNGTQGYAMGQGQRIEYTPEQIAAAKTEAIPFPELKINNATLDGIESYDSGKAYKIKVNDTKTVYFDTKTGLKVKTVQIQKMGNQSITSTVDYSDYKEVNGVKFPFSMSLATGAQKFDFKVSEVKINEGVTDEDFK